MGSSWFFLASSSTCVLLSFGRYMDSINKMQNSKRKIFSDNDKRTNQMTGYISTWLFSGFLRLGSPLMQRPRDIAKAQNSRQLICDAVWTFWINAYLHSDMLLVTFKMLRCHTVTVHVFFFCFFHHDQSILFWQRV